MLKEGKEGEREREEAISSIDVDLMIHVED